MLTKVKDTLPPGKQSNVVYHIPCSCGQVYTMLTKVKDTLPPGKQSNVVYHIGTIPCSCGQVYIRDQTKIGDEAEGTPRCLREGDDGEVSCSGTCVGAPPLDPLGGDHHTGPWQRTGVVGEGGLAHPDDTCGRALQPRWSSGGSRI